MGYQRKVFKRYFTEAEEKKLFKFVGSSANVYARRDFAWMTLMRCTGIRVGSMSGITVGEAREAVRTKHLVLSDEFAKGHKGYSVFVAQRGLKAIRQLLKVRNGLGHSDDDSMPLVMSRKVNQRLSIRSYQSRMRAWVRAAGLNIDASPHWLRHTFAKRLIKHSTASEPLCVVSSALGHANINTTLVYILPEKEDVEESIEAAC